MTQRHARCGRCGTQLARDNVTGRCAACRSIERDRVAQPPNVPGEFWRDEALQRALVSRHMGQVIRAYRCHQYHGRSALPQEIVASWVGITQAQLSRIEQGSAMVHLDRLIQWARVLRIPSDYLWFTLPDAPPALLQLPPQLPAQVDAVWLPAISAAADAPDSMNPFMRRRSWLTTLPAATAAGLLGLPQIERLRHGLVSSRDGDPADLDDWEMVAWEYGRTSANTPAHVLLDDLTLDLAVAHERLENLQDTAERFRLYRVLALLSVFTAHTLAGLGRTRLSWRWWRVARDYAASSADPEAKMWVMGRFVIGSLYERRPIQQILAYADEATVLATTTFGMGTGSVLIGRAQVLAVLGHEAPARQAIAQVHAALDRLPQRVTSDVDSLYGWPEHRLRHGESFVYSYLGDTMRAAKAQEEALALYPAQLVRERTQIRLHQAMCLVHSEGPTIAATYARQVLTELPADQQTEVVREVARAVLRLIPSKALGQAPVVELRELLAAPAAVGQSRGAP